MGGGTRGGARGKSSELGVCQLRPATQGTFTVSNKPAAWIELSSYRVRLTEDGVFEVCFYPTAQLTGEVAKQVMECPRKLFEKDIALPLLIDLRVVTAMAPEAWEFFAQSDESFAVASRSAILVRNSTAQVIGNAFLGLNKPRMPIRLFAEEPSAATWLRSNEP